MAILGMWDHNLVKFWRLLPLARRQEILDFDSNPKPGFAVQAIPYIEASRNYLKLDHDIGVSRKLGVLFLNVLFRKLLYELPGPQQYAEGF